VGLLSAEKCGEVSNLRAEKCERDIKMNLRKAAQAVVERWDTPSWKDVPATAIYIEALRQALAQPEQEPEPRGHCTCGDPTLLGYVHFRTRPCIYYTAPYTKTDNPDRVLHKEWVGLTDAERFYCNEYPVDDCCSDSILRAEAKLKEKNT
jgi:hypothetical protein